MDFCSDLITHSIIFYVNPISRLEVNVECDKLLLDYSIENINQGGAEVA